MAQPMRTGQTVLEYLQWGKGTAIPTGVLELCRHHNRRCVHVRVDFGPEEAYSWPCPRSTTLQKVPAFCVFGNASCSRCVLDGIFACHPARISSDVCGRRIHALFFLRYLRCLPRSPIYRQYLGGALSHVGSCCPIVFYVKISNAVDLNDKLNVLVQTRSMPRVGRTRAAP